MRDMSAPSWTPEELFRNAQLAGAKGKESKASRRSMSPQRTPVFARRRFSIETELHGRSKLFYQPLID